MSEYIGTVGEKITLTLKVINEYEYTDYKFSYYGTTKTIYTFADADGNVFVWKTSSCLYQKILVDGRDEAREQYFVDLGFTETQKKAYRDARKKFLSDAMKNDWY